MILFVVMQLSSAVKPGWSNKMEKTNKTISVRKKKLFWLDEFSGEAKGGLYFRCDLFKRVKKVEESGMKVVGIAIDDSWDIELIIEGGVIKN